jgi:hypothetical protein
MEVLWIPTYEDSIMKPSKHCLKERGRKVGEWEYNGGVDLLKVPCMHVCSDNNEISLYY